MEIFVMFGLLQFFTESGLFMIPLVLCSLVALAVIAERGWALRRRNVISESIVQKIEQLPPGSEMTELQNLSRKDPTMLGRLTKLALEHAQYPKEETTEALQARGRHEATMLERGLVIIEIIAYIAPLLGLLGTVSGLVHIFAEIGVEGITVQTTRLARGISEILNATIAGLTIAIPSYIAYSYYSRKIQTMVIEVETICADLVIKLYRQPGKQNAVLRKTRA